MSEVKELPPKVFKASNRWIQQFMNRKGLSLCRRTMSQCLPVEYEEKLLAFQHFIIKMRREHKYIPSQIGNADQTPVWFDALENITVEAKGKSVQVRTTGAERQLCTVMLCIKQMGENLHLTLSLKGNEYPRKNFLVA